MFKAFQSCEARAYAELHGWKSENANSTPLVLGNYVHSYFESKQAHERFIQEHRWDIYTKRTANKKDRDSSAEIKKLPDSNGKEKDYVLTNNVLAPYLKADKMINALKDDKSFQASYMSGEKELILTGDIGGVPWMGKLDSYKPGRPFFMDIKTVEDMHKRFWIQGEPRGHWGSFIEDRNYPLQMAVYQELIFQTYGVRPEPIIVAVTKQEPPDKAFIAIPQEYLDTAMSQLLEAQDRIETVRSGQVPPKRCEQCEYCRETKHLGAPISMTELIE